ncbi:MAG TPA: BLUF domain-containing protein [Methylocystis sp.]
MQRLAYFSNANLELNLSAIESLVEKSADRNRPLRISGALLYNGLNFLQILEGPGQAVTPLYLKIRKDPRHSGVVKVACERILSRTYPEWGMKLLCCAPEYAAARQDTAPDGGLLPAMIDGFFGFGHAAAFAELR